MRKKLGRSFIVILGVLSIGSLSLSSLSACSTVPDSGEAENGEAATTEDCREVQEHLAALRVSSVAKNSTLSQAELDKHRANFAVASEASLSSCADEHSKGWATCMLALSSASDIESCED